MQFLKEFLWVFREPMSLVLLVGQCLFFSRFLVQWIVSERRGESTVPLAFWFLSIVGSALSLWYFVWRREPILILAQCVGMFVYFRNLVLIRRKHLRERAGYCPSPCFAKAADDKPQPSPPRGEGDHRSA